MNALLDKLNEFSLLFASCDFKDLSRVGRLLTLVEEMAGLTKDKAAKAGLVKLKEGLEGFIMGEYTDRDKMVREMGQLLTGLMDKAQRDLQDSGKKEEKNAEEEKLKEIREYAENTASNMDELEQRILDFEKRSEDPALINDIFRLVHTFKSETGFVGLTNISKLCHYAESVFAIFRKTPVQVGKEVTDVLLAVVDAMKRNFAACAKDPAAAMAADYPALVQTLEKTLALVKKEDVQREILRLNKEDMGDVSLMTDFIAETREHLESIEAKILELETDPGNTVILNDIFRPLHTIKGVSGFLGLKHVNKVAHESENFLDLARNGKVSMDQESIDMVLDVVDVLRRLVNLIDQQVKGQDFKDEDYPQVGRFIEDIKAVTREKQASREDGFKTAVEIKPGRKLGELLMEKASVSEEDLARALSIQKEENGERKLGQILVDEKKATVRAVASALREQREVTVQTDTASIKVDTAKLDHLIDTVGELVISQTVISQNRSVTANRDVVLSKEVSHLSKIVRDIQFISMALRMVPVKQTFQKMGRLVRDLSTKSGKQVELVISGAETELDKNVIEQINDPLVHMIRNSVDHGIELPEERIKAGKPAAGKVFLHAYHQGGNIVIEIRDDGKGLNAEKIRSKALEKGLLAADAEPTEAELFNLIFLPGFSTADKVTDVSGRGVGMDVVRKNIEKLGGHAAISSVAGKGTLFTIRLPLTMAILDGMVIQVGEERYLIPVLSIKESLRPKKSDVSTIQGRGEVVNVRGNLIQLIRVHNIFGLTPKVADAWEGLVILVDLNGRSFGFLVDGLLGQQQVVIKSLKGEYRKIKGVSGAAILGDGHVGLILDPKGIVELALN